MYKIFKFVVICLFAFTFTQVLAAEQETLKSYGQGDKFLNRCKVEMFDGMVQGWQAEAKKHNDKENQNVPDKVKTLFTEMSLSICTCAAPQFKEEASKDISDNELAKRAGQIIQTCTKDTLSKVKMPDGKE